MELNKETELVSGLEASNDIGLVKAKEMIKANIDTASRCFVATGYYLKYIRDNNLYVEDGYENIWELAQEEFGISKSSASRFIGINDRFSKDGNSPMLLDKYKDFSSSKLSEMLTMSDEQIEQVTASTTRAEIREIKKPEKKEVVAPAQQETGTEKPIDDLDLSVKTYNCLRKAGIDTINEVATMTDDELIKVKNVSPKTLKEIKEKLDIAENNVPYPAKQESVQKHLEVLTKVDESVSETVESVFEEVENVSGDIVQSSPEEKPKPRFSAMEHLKEAIKREEESIDSMRESWSKKNPDALLKHETILLALNLYMTDLQYPVPLEHKTQAKIEQPDLPILKNNDQRKEFIEAYESWPVWVDLELTGEKYYKYDFDNNTSFVVKASTYHKWNGSGGYEEETTYGHEKYYIIGAENREKYKPKNYTFCESETNKTVLIDYLKEIQKK